MFLAFLRSFEIAPVGVLALHRSVAEVFVSATGNIFLLALQMAAPLLAVNFVVTFAFVILGKAAPSINVFSESFSVRVLTGIILLGSDSRTHGTGRAKRPAGFAGADAPRHSVSRQKCPEQSSKTEQPTEKRLRGAGRRSVRARP